MSSTPTYWDYLRLPQLLELQRGLDTDESSVSVDELHFIAVHQIYELWFKVIIRSMRLARDQLARPVVSEDAIPHVVHHLRRVNAILALMVQQWPVVETLAPQDFLEFRDKLAPASGFQSFQMRVVECLMGLDESRRIRYGTVDPLDHIRKLALTSPGGAVAWAALEEARAELSLLGALQTWLYRTPIQGSKPGDPDDDHVVATFVDSYLQRLGGLQNQQASALIARLGEDHRGPLESRTAEIQEAARRFLTGEDVVPEERHRSARVRAAALFIESYRELPLLAWPRLLLDRIVEMEENLLFFRHGHARMVERVIGRRIGTGGSNGVEYLDATASYRVFRDLWAIRTVLLPRDQVPELLRPDVYGFARV